MHVYDFDGTVYAGDSSVDFYFFCLRRQPSLLRYLPTQIGGFLGYAFGRYTKTQCKEKFFAFLGGLSDTAQSTSAFWRKYRRKIKAFYIRQHADTDVVISASPSFLLQEICDTYGVARLIATDADPASGRITGENCSGKEKVRRFFAAFPDAKIERFYSDSYKDAPLAACAEESYLVRGEKLLPWRT